MARRPLDDRLAPAVGHHAARLAAGCRPGAARADAGTLLVHRAPCNPPHNPPHNPPRNLPHNPPRQSTTRYRRTTRVTSPRWRRCVARGAMRRAAAAATWVRGRPCGVRWRVSRGSSGTWCGAAPCPTTMQCAMRCIMLHYHAVHHAMHHAVHHAVHRAMHHSVPPRQVPYGRGSLTTGLMLHHAMLLAAVPAAARRAALRCVPLLAAELRGSL